MFLFLLGATFLIASALMQFAKEKRVLVMSTFLLVSGMMIVGFGFTRVNIDYQDILDEYTKICISEGGNLVEEYQNLKFQCWNNTTGERYFP